MKPKFQSPKGMHDVLPEEQKYFYKIFRILKKILTFYNYQRIRTPILEETGLFSKGIGINTDVVEKEMYSFKTEGGDDLTLRPEGTAPAMRAYLENGMQSLPKPVKLWYFGPFFRHESPQFGRFRQFWQFGFESIGEEGPVRDAEITHLFYILLQKFKLKDVIVEVNSIGDKNCRPEYKKLLKDYLKNRKRSLCADCRRRLKKNPLRVLDCKEEKCRRIISQAPQIIDHLCQECHQHFKEYLEFLDELKIPYHLNPYLVRGLDYYTRTVFEVFSTAPVKKEEKEEKEEEEGKESDKEQEPEEDFSASSRLALGGGGRYDDLVELLGGKPTPAVGAACGVERVIWLMKKQALRFPQEKEPQVFLAQLGGLAKRKALKLMERFRRAGVPVLESLGRDSLRSQLSIADEADIKYTLILGHKEALEDRITIRDMESGKQEEVDLKDVVKTIKKKLKK